MERIKKIEILLMYMIILAITLYVPGIFLKIGATGLLSIIHHKIITSIARHETEKNLTVKELDFAMERLDSIQKISNEKEEIIAEEYIPIKKEFIEENKNYEIYKYMQIGKVEETVLNFQGFLDELDKEELCTLHAYLTNRLQVTIEQEKREQLDQKLTLVSFGLQDQLFKENRYTKRYQTTKQFYENVNSEELIAIRKRLLKKEKE